MTSPAVPLALFAASAAAAAGAVAPVADDPGFTLHVVLGVFAGTIWRMRYWFTDKGFQRNAMITDVSAMLALCMMGFGVCDYFDLKGWTAGMVAVFASVIGVEPLRKTAIATIDMWAKGWAGRSGGGAPPDVNGGQS